MNKLRKVISTITILALVLTFVLVIAGCTSNEAGTEIGDLAPNFQLQNMDGQTVSLYSLRGKPICVGFWQVRCPACWSEMSYIQQVYDEWIEKGLSLLMVNIAESTSMVEEFIQDYNFSFPVLLDKEGKVADSYGILFLPTKFFIDKDGIIQEKKIGPALSKAELELHLSKIIP